MLLQACKAGWMEEEETGFAVNKELGREEEGSEWMQSGERMSSHVICIKIT